MQSNITIQLTKDQFIETQKNTLAPHNFQRLKIAHAKEIVFNEGSIVVQSISHYLAHIEFFDYSFTRQTSIEFTVNKSAFFLYADLLTGFSQLCYQPMGKYRKAVPAGCNQIMVLTFRPDWLAYKCRSMTELKAFTSFFGNPEDQPMHLPRIPIANVLIRSLVKMNDVIEDMNMDDDGYIFINGCVNKYYNNLKRKNATAYYYHHKAADISSFIRKKFATEEAENLSRLAARFMVSERSLARLAKIAFGIPLHEQVIKLRIHFALDLLLTTDKPISEIAVLSGYKEPCYFSKVFKKHFGVCPKSVKRPADAAVRFELQL